MVFTRSQAKKAAEGPAGSSAVTASFVGGMARQRRSLSFGAGMHAPRDSSVELGDQLVSVRTEDKAQLVLEASHALSDIAEAIDTVGLCHRAS